MSPKLDRDAIMARRRILVASALAGVVATGCRKSEPSVCLNIAQPINEAGTVASSGESGVTQGAQEAGTTGSGDGTGTEPNAGDAAVELGTRADADRDAGAKRAAADGAADIPRPMVCLSPKRTQ